VHDTGGPDMGVEQYRCADNPCRTEVSCACAAPVCGDNASCTQVSGYEVTCTNPAS
jgi:hypothetical protein